MDITNFTRIGKAIIVQGTKSVTVSAGTAVIYTLATKGLEGVKAITFDQLLK